MMHVNIRSLQKEINFDSFLDTLATLKRKPDIICISETRSLLKKPLLILILKALILFLLVPISPPAVLVFMFRTS